MESFYFTFFCFVLGLRKVPNVSTQLCHHTQPMKLNGVACRVWADTSTGLELWCGFESRFVTLVSLSNTLNHDCFVLRMGRKAVGPVCCVTRVKESSALIEKRRGSPWCSWFDWLHIAPQHLVNLYMVLCKGIGLILQTYPQNTLQEDTECWSALSVTEWRIWALYKKPLLMVSNG